MPDEVEPRAFSIEATRAFADYPAEIWEEAITAIARATKRPHIDDIARALEVAYEPVERALERRRLDERRVLEPPPRKKRTPEEQAKVDAHVAEVWRLIGPLRRKAWVRPSDPGDGQHAERVMADLAARKARQEQRA
jgi:hypothetical protein